MNRLLIFPLFFFCLMGAAQAEAVFVITNKSNPNKIESTDLQDLFSGRKRMIGETKIDLIDQPPTSEAKTMFYQRLLNRSSAQASLAWSELVFSGRAKSPVMASDDADVLQMVMKNPNAIGYVSEKADTSKVNILLKLNE